MKKLLTVCLLVLLAVNLSAEVVKQTAFGIGECAMISSAYDQNGEGKLINTAGIFVVESWTMVGNFPGTWFYASTGKPSTSTLHYKDSNLSRTFQLTKKSRIVNMAGGLGGAIKLGVFSINLAVGPHIGINVLKYSDNYSDFDVTAGIGGTVELRLNFGEHFFLASGSPISYDLLSLGFSGLNLSDQKEASSFFAIGFSH